MTQAEKISISLPTSLVQFIETYKITKGCQSPSQVIEVALKLLQNQELESAYRQASSEIDPAWDITIADGLTDETW
ncbi:CopG family transcriptional regulator [Oscillatoriales cyanobacterium USR001]|nr:CopG family transcriptional regulator [Oscillatoriales cyanobacterium USR001]